MAEEKIRMGTSKRGMSLDSWYRKAFFKALAPVVFAHGVVIFGFVMPEPGIDYESSGGEIAVIDMPPEARIPPPPEEIARPATPVVGGAEVAETVTIAEADVVEGQEVPEISGEPSAPPPEPKAIEPARETFTFTPYTLKPKCREGCSPEAIVKHIPPLLRKAGFDCDLTVGIRIDISGHVTATDVIRPSGMSACDIAVSKWARTTNWTVAYNRDQPVAVWIAQPVHVTATK
ncbi:MAG: energy transducer TonB [Gemmatimonadota bacterium]|nr:energy transducer TonB [Gemmatimonadota bacterium]